MKPSSRARPGRSDAPTTTRNYLHSGRSSADSGAYTAAERAEAARAVIWRLRLAWAYREWPWRIPKVCRYIDTTRPPEHVFTHFRRLHGKDET